MARLIKVVAAMACVAGLAWGAVTLARQRMRRVYEWRIALPAAQAVESVAEPCACLSLNTATLEELESLPRIGAVLAERIVAYREAMGGYVNDAELLRIQGIGEATYDLLEPLVCVCTPFPALMEGTN